MKDAFNPYAPPSASLEGGNHAEGGVWRDGKVLVLRSGASLPDRCVKCNEPAQAPTKERKVYWHHPWAYVLILANILIYAIVASLIRKKAIVNPGLCQAHKKKRATGLWIGWGGGLTGALLLFGAGVNEHPAMATLGVLLLLASLVAAIVLTRIVFPQRIDPEIIRLRGCGPAFLDSLPAMRGRYR